MTHFYVRRNSKLGKNQTPSPLKTMKPNEKIFMTSSRNVFRNTASVSPAAVNPSPSSPLNSQGERHPVTPRLETLKFRRPRGVSRVMAGRTVRVWPGGGELSVRGEGKP
ncbi:hypothetical protein Pcinc_031774 [Petrolisthes cinctipes]|uniref:Uncharacterized protein n=1 Tax=Petrolisthes cinctipes TaxID=88211 RepID=A0AAE1K4D8_PETCI|nr:hypothetical protein Pcinc_031774 [Petrolisthes cinctipes]